jgi:uncharacterized protein (TIGR02757 family)
MSDPISVVHRYSDPLDQEVVALFAALLAYGNVKQILASLDAALERVHALQPRGPAAWAQELSKAPARRRALSRFESWVHRFNRGVDLVVLGQLIGGEQSEFGSVGQSFGKYMDPGAQTIEVGLNAWIQKWRKQARGLEGYAHTFDYLLTAPEDGSCCKRWNLLLRWMVRKDEIDLGLWASERLRPDQLVMPLDTHTGRISQYLGLTLRSTLNWKAALEVTQGLRECDPQDPIRYDFALCRLGILDLCQNAYRVKICEQCQLFPVCRIAQHSKSVQPSTS